MNVFKSKKGKEKILGYYNSILSTLPLTQKYVDTEFGKTFVLEAGDLKNPAVVLLHGSCSNSAAWLGDLPALSQTYHVYAVDLPGEPGNSNDRRLNFNSDEYPCWLKDVLDDLGEENAIIIGNSMGGWLALHFAANFPDRTRALALLSPSGLIPPKQDFLEQTADIASDPKASANSSSAVIDQIDLPKEVLEFMTLIMENFNPFTGALPILSDEQMNNLNIPVFYMAGKNDITMNTKEASQRLEKFVPHAKIILNDGAHIITSAADSIIPFLKEALS
ncbi:alpha/beta hydrolase [Eubacteriaceae bacterium ES3]|nr:alpha/beta hydrolase [Eubacteriaceae bacterium ES3]